MEGTIPTGKKWYQSKTIWVNVIAFALWGLALATGQSIEPEVGVGILAIINLGLRILTKEPLG